MSNNETYKVLGLFLLLLAVAGSVISYGAQMTPLSASAGYYGYYEDSYYDDYTDIVLEECGDSLYPECYDGLCEEGFFCSSSETGCLCVPE